MPVARLPPVVIAPLSMTMSPASLEAGMPMARWPVVVAVQSRRPIGDAGNAMTADAVGHRELHLVGRGHPDRVTAERPQCANFGGGLIIGSGNGGIDAFA